MLRTTKFTIFNAAIVLALSACVEEFSGSNIQLDFRNYAPPNLPASFGNFEFPVQVGYGATPSKLTELPQNSHFTLYGVPDTTQPGVLVELLRFEIHRLVDLNSPCFIDAGDNVPYPGLHVTEYAEKVAEDNGFVAPFSLANPPPNATDRQKIEVATAEARHENIVKYAADLPDVAGRTGVRPVTSASTSVYPAVAADCNGGDSQIPPPTCIDDVSNARRLRLCQAAWAGDANLWEGTDRVLTAPLNGFTRGNSDGVNPVNLAPVDGASFFLPDTLLRYQGFAIFTQLDGVDGPGTRLATSTAALSHPTRGVTRSILAGQPFGATMQPVVVLMAIFSDIDNDSVHF